ncbi:MAG TPA: hypothetical protein VGD81_06930 [Opitutaceae bacterium]
MPPFSLPDASWLRDDLRPSSAEVEPLAWIVWAYERRNAADFERCRTEVEIHLWATRCAEETPKRPDGTSPAGA